MGRTAKPRKRYRPHGVNLQSVAVAIQGAALLTLEDRIAWQQDLADALAAVRTANASRDQWAALFDAINICEELCRMRLASDDQEVVPRAQAAVVAILDRMRDSGVRSARGAELAALADLVAAYADLMEGITHQQRDDAIQRAAARIRHVLASAAPTGDVRVVEMVGNVAHEAGA